MTHSDIAVSVRGLSKSYKIGTEREKHSTLTESLLATLRSPFRRTPPQAFDALNDVSFDVRKGEVVGIIGRNGAGKSTLLKILSRITEPTTGEVDLYGRVGSLLEVGTGFHPELTGRENIYLNGAILGLTKREITNRFDAIVDFSGCEKFLDTPVKRYSSGMYVRLAFAVAAHLEPEILIIDEVLAVGDLQFQKKCLGKLGEVSRQGRTVIFVSHDIRTIRNLCTHGIHLSGGQVVTRGPIEDVVAAYTAGRENQGLPLPVSKGNFALNEFDVIQNGAGGSILDGGSSITVMVRCELKEQMDHLRVGIYVKTPFGDTVIRSFTSDWEPERESVSAGSYLLNLTIPGNLLMAGSYRVGLHASQYGLHGLISEADVYRDITLLPPSNFNVAHPSEPIDSTIMLASRWTIDRP